MASMAVSVAVIDGVDVNAGGIGGDVELGEYEVWSGDHDDDVGEGSIAVDDEIDVEVSINGEEAQVLSPRLLQTHRVTRREA
jgi:hypothetical protein